RSRRLPVRPRPGAPTAAAAPPSTAAVDPTPDAREGPPGPPPDARASTDARSADRLPSARPRHEREGHARAGRSRGLVAARARPGSPVGACAPPTEEYRTLLMQKSLVAFLASVRSCPF